MTGLRGLGIAGVTLAATVTLAACGTTVASSNGGSPAPATSMVTSPSTEPSSTPTGGPIDTKVRATIIGTVTQGVEKGCLLLEPDTAEGMTGSGGAILLTGAIDGLTVGQHVTIHGRVDRSLVTFCQQGTPYVVTSWSPK